MPLSFVPTEDNEYPRWVTETQIKYLEAVKEHGSQRAAAKALGVAPNAVWESLDCYKKAAARHGRAPGHFNDGVAPGFAMGKVTVQRNAFGAVERTWERQSPGAEAEAERLRAIRAALLEDLQPIKPLTAPDYTDDDLNDVRLDGHVGGVEAIQCEDKLSGRLPLIAGRGMGGQAVNELAP